MAKSHQSDNPLFKALQKKYEADIAAAFAVLVVYFDNSVGINAEEKIQALNKHFNNTQI